MKNSMLIFPEQVAQFCLGSKLALLYFPKFLVLWYVQCGLYFLAAYTTSWPKRMDMLAYIRTFHTIVFSFVLKMFKTT